MVTVDFPNQAFLPVNILKAFVVHVHSRNYMLISYTYHVTISHSQEEQVQEGKQAIGNSLLHAYADTVQG